MTVATTTTKPIVISLPLPPLHLHPNYTGSFASKKPVRKRARHEAMLAAYNHRRAIPLARCRARADWVMPAMRTRDPDNLTAWLKAYLDGITDAKVWADDSLAVVTWEPPTVTIDKSRQPGVTITIYPEEGSYLQ